MEEYIKKLNHNYSCFSIESCDSFERSDEESTFFDISQDVADTKVIVDSIFATNLLELFIMNEENLLLHLPKTNKKGDLIYYSASTHAINVYFLKQLEKYDIVQIHHFVKTENVFDLDEFSMSFLNFKKKKNVPLYDIEFTLKKNNIQPENLMLLNEKMGISYKTFCYHPIHHSFEYSYLYQLKRILENTLGVKRIEKGFVRNFDRNVKLWNLPIRLFHSMSFASLIAGGNIVYEKKK